MYLHNLWISMHGRCKYLDLYLLQGINVCAEWSEFEPFKKWAVENGFRNGLTLDRKDSSKDYSPNNCRWATRSQQNRNTRKVSCGTSQYKGVSWCRQKNKWRACVSIGSRGESRQIHLGFFDFEKDAAKAYDAWVYENWGEFACGNFPKS